MLLSLSPTSPYQSPVLFIEDAEAAPSWAPGGLIAGWVKDGDYIKLPIASLSEFGVTADDADPSSGDARQCAAALVGAVYTWFVGQATKPTAVTSALKLSINQVGSYVDKQQMRYTVDVSTDFPGFSVSDEAS
jgi:hypothetical protein